jgi:hypothetical protein
MFPLSRNFLKFAAAGALVALAAVGTPASADEMVQHLGPVAPYEPILAPVGNKRVVAFFVSGNGQCNVRAVFWNADDMEAKSAGAYRVSLNPGQTVSIDSSMTQSVTLRCGDDAETLAAIDTDQRFTSE